MSCKKYTLIETECPCLINLQNTAGHIIALNLFGAVVYPHPDSGFAIKTLLHGANVSEESDFTVADIQELICECMGTNPT